MSPSSSQSDGMSVSQIGTVHTDRRQNFESRVLTIALAVERQYGGRRTKDEREKKTQHEKLHQKLLAYFLEEVEVRQLKAFYRKERRSERPHLTSLTETKSSYGEKTKGKILHCWVWLQLLAPVWVSNNSSIWFRGERFL